MSYEALMNSSNCSQQVAELESKDLSTLSAVSWSHCSSKALSSCGIGEIDLPSEST